MSRYHSLAITEVRRETSDAVSILLQVPDYLKDEFQFQAGQFVNVRVILHGEEVRRSYSICSTPMSGALRVAVKKVSGGKFSTYASDVLKPGDMLEVMPPEGKFTVRHEDENGNTYVFFAAGSGITPVISLIKTILQTMPGMQVVLFYGNRTIDSIIFREELDALKNLHLGRFELHHILSGEKQEVPLFNGRIDEDKCKTFAKVFFQIASVRRFFICGPELMNFSLRNSLIELGVDEKHIAIELFTTPGDKNLSPIHLTHKVAIDPKKECHVTVRIDGDTTEFSLAYGGQSILDAATAAGVDVPFSCKGGVCCTCKAMLLDGEVDMDVVYGLEPDEVEDGFILTCQSHPRSEIVLVDYDIR
ncbi:MAG TPA: 2Fe-2S iron-sulfur cluster-binding protein [Saprospiraceae bacterium]|nr:2Fe-2S iron-sulfur cluster-binding protein [Saprospiraceae bacterium]